MDIQPTPKDVNRAIIAKAIELYMKEFRREGDPKLIRPGLNSSTVEGDHVCLRTGKILLAVYDQCTGVFLKMNANIIKNYSK